MADWITVEDLPDIDAADIARANRTVDWLIAGAVYVADEHGDPASQLQREACKTAAKLLAAHYAAGDDDSGPVSLGSLSLPALEAHAGRDSDAVRVLRRAGLGWQVI